MVYMLCRNKLYLLPKPLIKISSCFLFQKQVKDLWNPNACELTVTSTDEELHCWKTAPPPGKWHQNWAFCDKKHSSVLKPEQIENNTIEIIAILLWPLLQKHGNSADCWHAGINSIQGKIYKSNLIMTLIIRLKVYSS